MYQDEFSRYLTDNTYCSWHRVPRLYADFKIATSPTGNVCVATPDIYPRQEPFCRFYMPKSNEHIHHPRLFVDEVLNARSNLAKALPWIKLDLDHFPRIKNKTRVLTAEGYTDIEYEITLTGDVKMRKIGSLNNQTLGISTFHNIAYNAKEEFMGIANTVKANFDFSKMTVSIGESVTGPLGTTSFKLISDGSIEAEYTPKGSTHHIQYKGWQYQLQLGYKLLAKYQHLDTQPPHHTSFAHKAEKALEYTAVGFGCLVLLAVTFGGAAIPEATGAAAIAAF